MYRLLLLFCCVFSCLSAHSSRQTVRFHIPGEKLVVSEEGILFSSKNHGKISLPNIFFSKGSYYTVCQVEYECKNCQRIQNEFVDTCEFCLSSEIGLSEACHESNAHFLTAYDILAELLTNNEEFLCGTFKFRGRSDTDGNSSLELEVEDSNDSGNFSWSATGRVNRDDEGSVNGEVEVELGLEF
jgi:hypothetical protein